LLLRDYSDVLPCPLTPSAWTAATLAVHVKGLQGRVARLVMRYSDLLVRMTSCAAFMRSNLDAQVPHHPVAGAQSECSSDSKSAWSAESDSDGGSADVDDDDEDLYHCL
jgi:hypothetical protein